MGKEQGDMQKNKLLLLTEILKQETDADHPITTKAIIEKLSGYDITCDRRTLARDISQLLEMNYPVLSTKMQSHSRFPNERWHISL